MPNRVARTLLLSAVPLLVGSAPVPVVDDGLQLQVVVAADSASAAASSDERVFTLTLGTSYRYAIVNPGASPRYAELWQLVGTRSEQQWKGTVPAGGKVQIGMGAYDAAGTEVLLVKWSDGRRLDDTEDAPMEGDKSRLYYLVAERSGRPQVGQGAPAAARRMRASRSARRSAAMRGPLPAPALEAAFDSSAAARKESFELLLATRSASRVLIGTPNFKALRLALGSAYPEGTAMLMYAPAGDTLITWVITPRGELHRAVTPGLQAGIDAMAQLRLALQLDQLQAHRAPRLRGTKPEAPAAVAPPLPQALQAVADFLLPRALHGALRDAKQLVIVPALDIGAVPFAALPHPAGGQVVDHSSVVLAPSICDVVQLGHRVFYEDVAGSALVVGNPTFPSGGEWEFPPLPGATVEAEAVAAQLGHSAITGDAATREAVQRDIAGASLLYFATHGIASADNPMDGSFLQFAGNSRGGRLTAREIQNFRLRARLAVLSACQTGLGMAHDGGIIGVARSFVNAGASQVVMSLWNVDDEATQQLMLRFMHHLQTVRPPEALRLAMLDQRGSRRNRQPPALWASFTVLGATW